MCRPQCVLALVVLYVGLVHCFTWEFAASYGPYLDFYINGIILTHSENMTSGNVRLITYDVVHNRMFFVQKENMDTLIYSYDMTTKKIKSVVPRALIAELAWDLAFDPVEEILFWIDRWARRIYWFSLKPGSQNNDFGNLLMETSFQGPKAIAVDSCRGFIYWASTDEESYRYPSLIERARFDGSEREVVIDTNLYKPQNLVIDQQTQKLYWTDGTLLDLELSDEDKQFSIESADLNGKNRTMFYQETGIEQPKSLAVSKDSIYWVHELPTTAKTARKLPKNKLINAKPRVILINECFLIVTNYKIKDQIQGIHNCDTLKKLLPNNSDLTDKCDSSDSQFCVHGTKVSGESYCECAHGYIGERCDVPICQNYCFQGNCSVSAEGHPKCSCNANYSGERCEVNICQGYCLHDGVCSLNEESEPVCQCKGGYEGQRCDISSCLNRLNKHFETVAMLRDVLNAGVTPGNLDKNEKSTCAATIF